MPFKRLAELRNRRLPLRSAQRDFLGERLVLRRLEVLEREVFQLPPDSRHSEPVRQRGVQIARLLRDPLLTLDRKELQRPHVVQTVGELDEDDARILGDREQQLAVVLDLTVLRRIERQVADLRQPVDDLGDFLSEFALDIGDGDVGVFDHVVDQRRGDGDRVQLEVDENLRDLDAVVHICVAGETLLPFVCALAEPIGARKQLLIEPIRKRRFQQPGRECLPLCACRHSSPASAKLM